MKPLYLLFILLILFTSCSDWKYSNGTQWKKPESVSVRHTFNVPSEKSKAKVNEELAAEESEEENEIETTGNVAEVTVTPVPAEASEIIVNPSYAHTEISRLKKDDDTIARDEEIVSQALKAEKQGKKGMIFGIIGIALTFMPFFIVGFIFSIIALTKSISSLRSRYNTPKGLRQAKVGVILSSIALALSILALAAIILLILFL